MRKKRNDFDAVDVERMTDAELSKKLGGYQRTESITQLITNSDKPLRFESPLTSLSRSL